MDWLVTKSTLTCSQSIYVNTFMSMSWTWPVEIEKESPKHHSKVQVTEERCNDQAVVAESIWASKELLELIEAMPYCEQFIHSFEELMPRGLGS